eukprot:Sspe_Gene.70664::Locus_41737_Transcript_1_1_Confidence_1.000_Length_1121::g.70664::m.70664
MAKKHGHAIAVGAAIFLGVARQLVWQMETWSEAMTLLPFGLICLVLLLLPTPRSIIWAVLLSLASSPQRHSPAEHPEPPPPAEPPQRGTASYQVPPTKEPRAVAKPAAKAILKDIPKAGGKEAAKVGHKEPAKAGGKEAPPKPVQKAGRAEAGKKPGAKKGKEATRPSKDGAAVVLTATNKIFSMLNRTNALMWPSEEMKEVSGASAWGDWHPEPGMHGTIAYYWLGTQHEGPVPINRRGYLAFDLVLFRYIVPSDGSEKLVITAAESVQLPDGEEVRLPEHGDRH